MDNLPKIVCFFPLLNLYNKSCKGTRLPLILALIITFTGAIAQTDSIPPDSAKCAQRDLSDVIRAAMHKPPKVKTEKTSSIIAFPIIGSNPATGFMVGLGGQYAFKMAESSKYSIRDRKSVV